MRRIVLPLDWDALQIECGHRFDGCRVTAVEVRFDSRTVALDLSEA